MGRHRYPCYLSVALSLATYQRSLLYISGNISGRTSPLQKLDMTAAQKHLIVAP